MGVLNKFGSHAGSGSTAVIIASTQVPVDDEAQITDFKVAAASGGANSVVMLEKSNDNFATNVKEVDRHELPTAGSLLTSLDTPIKIPGGSWFRVRFSQGTPGTLGVGIYGQTKGKDILD